MINVFKGNLPQGWLSEERKIYLQKLKENKRPIRNKYKSKLNRKEERLHAEASDGTSSNVPSVIRMTDPEVSLSISVQE
jgi:predicted nucleotidyltransferase